jgi:hypothetical protein
VTDAKGYVYPGLHEEGHVHLAVAVGALGEGGWGRSAVGLVQRSHAQAALELAHEGALVEAGVNVELLRIFRHGEMQFELTTDRKKVPLQGLQEEKQLYKGGEERWERRAGR